MSSDTAKENASVVDSSVTEWKHDMGNLDDRDSPSYKANEGAYRSEAEEQAQSCDQVGTLSGIKKGNLRNTRYFIIKSLNHENLHLSIEKGIWATQVMNEPILEEAFHNTGKVILIFSVNMSGFFQGYAQMTSSIGWRRDTVWSKGSGGSNPWGRSFKVKWLRLNDLPFQKTLHLKNPLNDYKPVKISRDCQELPQDIGEALCELLDRKIDVDYQLKSNDFSRDDHPSKRPCIESACFLRDEDYNGLPPYRTLDTSPMLYPSLLFQHQAEASRFHLAYQRPSFKNFQENLSINSGESKVTQLKQTPISGSLPNIQVEQDNCSQFDVWGLSAERSPHTSTLTDNDILEMTYEEYLEAHSRSTRTLYHHTSESSQRMQDLMRNKERSSHLLCGSKKRTHHQSLSNDSPITPAIP